MGNSNSKWSEERSGTAESKWTYRNGQVYYDGYPWPPRTNTTTQYVETRNVATNTNITDSLPQQNNQGERSFNTKSQLACVNIRKINESDYMKLISGGRAIVTEGDKYVVKGKRGRPSKIKHSLQISSTFEQASQIFNDTADDKTDEVCTLTVSKPTIEARSEPRTVIFKKFNEAEDIEEVIQQQNTKMPRTYSNSSNPETTSSSCDESSDESSSSSDTEEEKKRPVTVEYHSKMFRSKKGIDEVTYNTGVKERIKTLKNKLKIFEEKFDPDIIEDCKEFIKNEYPKALIRFKLRGSLEIQCMLLTAFLKHKISYMDEKHRKEAERIYGRKADSTYVPKPKYPPPNNGLDRGLMTIAKPTSKNRMMKTISNSKSLGCKSTPKKMHVTHDNSKITTEESTATINNSRNLSSKDDSTTSSDFEDSSSEEDSKENLQSLAKLESLQSSIGDANTSPVSSSRASEGHAVVEPHDDNMSLKNQSLAYTTSLKIKQELIENTDQHPVATKTDIDLMPVAKASKSILDHQSTSASPISINSSPTATTLSAPIKSPKVSVPLELKTTSSTEVESSPKSAEYKTVSSVETVLPKTPIKENRPSADLLASASHMSQSSVYSKTPKSCCSVKRPRSPSENQAGRVSSNALSKRSVPKVAHGKSSITTSRDHKTYVTKKTPKRVSPKTSSASSVTKRSKSPPKTPSRPAPVKTPKSPSTKLTMTPKSVVGTPPRTASSSKTNFNKSNQSFANEPRSENIQSQAEVRKTRSRTPSSDLSMPLLVSDSAQTPTSTKKSRSDVTPRQTPVMVTRSRSPSLTKSRPSSGMSLRSASPKALSSKSSSRSRSPSTTPGKSMPSLSITKSSVTVAGKPKQKNPRKKMKTKNERSA